MVGNSEHELPGQNQTLSPFTFKVSGQYFHCRYGVGEFVSVYKDRPAVRDPLGCTCSWLA